MNLIGTAWAGIYVVVATRAASAAAEGPGGSQTAGEVITCEAGKTVSCAVSQPDTTVKVTFPGIVSSREISPKPDDYIFDANCDKPVVLSNVCPGATVSPPQKARTNGGDQEGEEAGEESPTGTTIVTLRFPQLPASQQVVCVKYSVKAKSDNAKAVITVAAAPPQGPQACAVGNSSITLEINEAAGSAQFKCGGDRTPEPTERTKAYKDDCSTVETLKDMTRSDGSKNGYVTVKVYKLRKKILCYLCQPGVSSRQQNGGKHGPCKVYVQVSGSTKSSSSVPYGLALPCLAAMLRFT